MGATIMEIQIEEADDMRTSRGTNPGFSVS